MKRSLRISLLSVFIFLIPFFSHTQDYDPMVNDLIVETNLDSLIKFTREITGEDSVMVNGLKVLIKNRVHHQNDIAAEYIKQKLTGFGLTPLEQTFNSTGKNIYAIKPGSVYPDKQYIICAHYDAVADYCADDNASSCAAVLESARLLTNIDFEYTIIFAFWDEEEIGLYGSSYYADLASQNNDSIKGVINLEMLGWDSNGDMKFDIHTRDYANSVELADLLVTIDETYNLLLDPVIFNPGTTASDHSSFWNEGYSALCFSEGFFSGDGNPYYHTSLDRIEHFNLPYFHELSKLAIGTISTLGRIHLDSIQLELTVYLEGALQNSEMTTELNNLNQIPMTQPYSGPPWDYDGLEDVESIPENVTDWVLIDLRESDEDASTATAEKSIEKKAAFLMQDGSIKDTSGINNLVFILTATENIYIVIHHRNHISVVSAFPSIISNDIGSYDFSSGEFQVYGGSSGHKQLSPGTWGMTAGDSNADGTINLNDKQNYWDLNAGEQGYFPFDFSMDSQVNNIDKNDFWFLNFGFTTQVP